MSKTTQITHLKTGELVRNNVDKVLKSMLQEGTIQQVNTENMPSVFVRTCLVSLANSSGSRYIAKQLYFIQKIYAMIYIRPERRTV